MSPSKPPEPEEDAGPSDKPGGVVYKDGKPVTVKRKPTKEETKEKKRIERERRKKHRKEEREKREERAREKAEEVSVPHKEFPEAPERPAHVVKPVVERPGELGITTKPVKEPDLFPDDRRLDDQPYPGEPTFSERLHGVKVVSVPPPKFVEDIGKLGTKYEEAMGLPSAFIREKAAGTLTKAEEAKLAGKDVRAGALYSSYMAQRSLAGAWEGLTLPLRPKAMYRTVKTGVGLIVDPKVRKGVVETAKADPGGFTAEVSGGALGGTVLGGALRKMGLIKPSSYRLRKTTRAREVTNVAYKMPKGKWPSRAFDKKLWDFGGTPVLMDPETGLVTVWKPVPVYKPSLIEPGMGLLSGLRPFTVSEKRPISTVKVEPISLPRGYLDVVQRTETLTKPTIRGVTETAIILKPVEYTERKTGPWIAPGYISAPKPVTRTRGKRTQEQIVAQTMKMDYVPVQRTRLKPLKMDLILEEKRKKPMSLKGLTTIGETRIRPIRPPRLKK